MTDQTKQKLKYWFIGLFTGGAVAAPVTAFVCKNIYDKKMNEAVAKAADEAETKGMNAMAEYAISQQNQEKTLTEEDYAEPTEYDVSIDNEEAAEDQEAKERTEAHQRYLDMIDKYKGDDDGSVRIISSDQFINEAYMEKSYINWYEEDNVFEEDLNTIDDPFVTFGVTDGHELFKNSDLREDPDICYLRNEKQLTDYEISRIHGSYARMVRGEANLGETDT